MRATRVSIDRAHQFDDYEYLCISCPKRGQEIKIGQNVLLMNKNTTALTASVSKKKLIKSNLAASLDEQIQ